MLGLAGPGDVELHPIHRDVDCVAPAAQMPGNARQTLWETDRMHSQKQKSFLPLVRELRIFSEGCGEQQSRRRCGRRRRSRGGSCLELQQIREIAAERQRWFLRPPFPQFWGHLCKTQNFSKAVLVGLPSGDHRFKRPAQSSRLRAKNAGSFEQALSPGNTGGQETRCHRHTSHKLSRA